MEQGRITENENKYCYCNDAGRISDMYKTKQEDFWAGEFGNDYIKRNQGDQLLASNLALFSEVIRNTRQLNSVVEFGCNVGMNLKAIRLLCPQIECCGIEINQKAADILKNEKVFGNKIQVYNETIFDIELPRQSRRNIQTLFRI